MNTESNRPADGREQAEVHGEITRRLSWAPVRVLAILTGFVLIRGLLVLGARFCLALRRKATLALRDSCLILKVEWTILGRKIRRTTTQAPIGSLGAVELENRQRYLYLLVGFGCLAIGTWIGIQWFVDGLRAGYPYLALVGAGIVAAGILLDLGLYLFIPNGSGKSRLVIAMGPWKVRLMGVNENDAQKFLSALLEQWNDKSAKRS